MIASQAKAPEDLAGVRTAAQRFLRALDYLDWATFQTSWASEPTAFFPFGDTPDRVTGKTAVESRWRRFFEETRTRRPGPPYLHLKPRDLRLERLGDVGLVTFMLDGLSTDIQALVSRAPINRYHVLVVPRRHVEHLAEVPSDLLAQAVQVAQRVSVAIVAVARPDAITLLSDDDLTGAGFNEVAHWKLHLIPRYRGDDVIINWRRAPDPGARGARPLR